MKRQTLTLTKTEKSPEIAGDYYVTDEQLDAIRHLVFALQGVSHGLGDEDECLGVAELFQGFSSGLQAIHESIHCQRVGGAA